MYNSFKLFRFRPKNLIRGIFTKTKPGTIKNSFVKKKIVYQVEPQTVTLVQNEIRYQINESDS